MHVKVRKLWNTIWALAYLAKAEVVLQCQKDSSSFVYSQVGHIQFACKMHVALSRQAWWLEATSAVSVVLSTTDC